MRLTFLTPEAKIISTLMHGKHTYGELRFETGLSDRWLTLKLKELEGSGILGKAGRWYSLSRELELHPYELSLQMSFQAERIAQEIAKLDFVQTIILFGGVVKKNARQDSDLDVMIIVNEPADEVKQSVYTKISELESKFHQAIDPLILTEDDFIANVNSHEGGIIYGLAEGCEVLIDKTEGKLTKILHERIDEIKDTHEHLDEVGIWLRIK